MAVPPSRITALNECPVRGERRYILYWMTTARRLERNYGLQRAVDHCAAHGKPLVILEAIRCDYPHACDRFHAFVLEGMAEHGAELARHPVRYYPYVEPVAQAGRGLLAALASDACIVVADWYPAFFLPSMTTSAAGRIDVRLEAVDSNGILPVLGAGRAFTTAQSFRAAFQRRFREQTADWPDEHPLARLPRAAPAPKRTDLSTSALARLPIDHGVHPVATTGGAAPARRRLAQFLGHGLARYAADHAQPEQDATSRLSPWLHFGHISVHEVFDAVMKHDRWSTTRLAAASRGAREGWWNASPSVESFLDELITWRELAFNTCAYVPDHASFTSLPPWAQQTLNAHRRDRRAHVYTIDELDTAMTHDRLWNAIQRQLAREGWVNGYLRMLWGKKILEWSPSPQAALDTMEQLMNRYAVDGRDPNSWAGFAWVLGRYDRPWPEREIFGTVRYMSSENAMRKLRLRQYTKTYAARVAVNPQSPTFNSARRT
jgi:deoxyribodipyrimidine photo-lyase